MSKLITNTLRHTGGSSDNITLTSGGHVLLGDGGNDNAFFKAHAADGEASDLYVGQFINAEATAGVNYGVNIQGGSNSTDHGLRVKNHAGTAQLLVRGDGEVQIGSGDLVFGTAGKGICLGATSNTDANTLDDYEEGTWTPTESSLSLTVYTANYVKIGKLVHVDAGILIPTNSDGGELLFGGLPFTAKNTGDNSCGLHLTSTNSGIENVTIYAIRNTTTIGLANYSNVAIARSSFSNKQLKFSGTYIST